MIPKDKGEEGDEEVTRAEGSADYIKYHIL